MGGPESTSTNGAVHASSSSDSSSLASPDDPPSIAEPPDICEPKHQQIIHEHSSSREAVAIEKPSCPHTLPAQSVAEQLGTDIDNGLSSDDAAARLVRDGPNSIKGAKGISIWEIFLQQVANALTVVLIAVAVLSFAINDYVEASVVVAVIVLNIVVGYGTQPSLPSNIC